MPSSPRRTPPLVAAAAVLLTALFVLGACSDEPDAAPDAAAPTPTATVTVTEPGSPAADPSGSSEASPDPALVADAVPDGFPLAVGLVNDDGSPATPSADGEGVRFEKTFCGNDVWPATATVDRLAVASTGPEYREARELVVLGSADDAVAVLAGLRQAVASCPVLPGSSRGNDVLLRVADEDTGYDSVTFSSTYRRGLGGTVYQFNRVGRAVLAYGGSGEYATASALDSVSGITTAEKPLLQQLCPFTAAGC